MAQTGSVLVELSKESLSEGGAHGDSYVGRIPVRNIWLLMFYASKLFRYLPHTDRVRLEDNPDDIPDLVARILLRQVELRIKRNLSSGYQTREETLRRVRGRINMLVTEVHGLSNKGQVFCRFDELTVNTPRNCFVRSALEEISGKVRCRHLAHSCRSMAQSLYRMGVVGANYGRTEASVGRFGFHDMPDKKMVAAAHFAFNLNLPTESEGKMHSSAPDRDIKWLRKLYEKGVAGFYDVVLAQEGWSVDIGKKLSWQESKKSSGMGSLLPHMYADMILTNKLLGRRIVIDTKFNSLLVARQYGGDTIRSSYIYQIYAYLSSQNGSGNALEDTSAGVLLHPSIGKMINEAVVIKGHEIRVATVDLGGDTGSIRSQLLGIVESCYSLSHGGR